MIWCEKYEYIQIMSALVYMHIVKQINNKHIHGREEEQKALM